MWIKSPFSVRACKSDSNVLAKKDTVEHSSDIEKNALLYKDSTRKLSLSLFIVLSPFIFLFNSLPLPPLYTIILFIVPSLSRPLVALFASLSPFAIFGLVFPAVGVFFALTLKMVMRTRPHSTHTHTHTGWLRASRWPHCQHATYGVRKSFVLVAMLR